MRAVKLNCLKVNPLSPKFLAFRHVSEEKFEELGVLLASDVALFVEDLDLADHFVELLVSVPSRSELLLDLGQSLVYLFFP
jgi:hypothetical protein